MAKDDPWLDEDQLAAWLTLVAFSEVFPASVDAQLKERMGVNRFEYSVLAMLSEEPGHTLVMSDLARVTFGSLSRLSHAVGRLEQRGWLERQAGAGGRRHTVVTLTDAGRIAIESAAPDHAAHLQSVMIEPLTPSQLAALTTIARKLVARIDPDMDRHLAEMIPEVVQRNLG
ncbi:MAG: MarR family transcriptional regulator [Actinomycetota bacterium]